MATANSVRTSKFHQSVGGREVINLGRINSGGEHRENIVATADKTPKRGDTGAGHGGSRKKK